MRVFRFLFALLAGGFLCAGPSYSASLQTAGLTPKEGRVEVFGKHIAYLYHEPPARDPSPMLLLVPPSNVIGTEAARGLFEQWAQPVAAAGWNLVVASTGELAPPWTDPGVKALEAVVEDCARQIPIDRSRVYLTGIGDAAAAAFYAVSRIPDVWAAAIALHGSPAAAIATNRLFGVNSQWTPLLWIVRPDDASGFDSLRQKLDSAKFRYEFRPSENVTLQEAMEWLGQSRRDPHPAKIDCETGNPAFTRCYWITITRPDPARRNDVLGYSRVPPGSGAHLNLGGFGFSPSAPGPGVLVGWLPDGYKGPLKLEDRIVSVGGKPIAEAADYVRLMDQSTEERPVAVVVLRGKSRVRLETQILLPKREENVTARVQAEYLPVTKDLLIITRGVAELRVELPAAYAPCTINWNGTEIAKPEAPGCLLLSDTGTPGVKPCGQ